MLPRLDQPWSLVFSTYFQMWESGTIRGTKRRSFASRVTSSKPFVVMYPGGLLNGTRRCWVVEEKDSHQMNHSPPGFQQTPPMPEPEALVAPIQVGGGSIYLRRFGHSYILASFFFHGASSSWAAADSLSLHPLETVKAC